MITNWRADEPNEMKLTLEINNSKSSVEANELFYEVDYDDLFKAFIGVVTALTSYDEDYCLNRTKDIINGKIINKNT